MEESPPEPVYDAPFNRLLRVHRNLFTLSRAYRVAPDAPAAVHVFRADLMFQICDGKVCSNPRNKGFMLQLKIGR